MSESMTSPGIDAAGGSALSELPGSIPSVIPGQIPGATIAPAAPLPGSVPSQAGIFKAMASIKRRMPSVGKGGETTGFAQYKYRKFDDVMNAVSPVLAEFGVTITSAIVAHELKEVPGKGGKVQYLSTVTMVHRFFAEDGSYMECSTVGHAMDVGDKAPTKAQTVSLRIALCSTLSIAFEDMEDIEGGDNAPITRSPILQRVVGTLDTTTDRARLKQCVGYVHRCLTQVGEDGEYLTAGMVLPLLPKFEEAGRRCRLSQEDLAAMTGYLLGGCGVGQTEPEQGEQPEPEPENDPQHLEESGADAAQLPILERISGLSTDSERIEFVRDVIDGVRGGSIDKEHQKQIAATYAKSIPAGDVPGYCLIQMISAPNQQSVSEAVGVLNQAHQQEKLDPDTYAALSQFGQFLLSQAG